MKAFQDPISNLQFDETSKSLSFVMPFHWEHAGHTHLVRNDILMPKEFAPYQNIGAFKGTINGISIFPSGLHYDIYSDKNVNTLHFLVTGVELEMMSQKLGSTDKHSMTVVITPDTDGAIRTADILFPNSYKATVSYDQIYVANRDVMLTIAFFDQSGELAKGIRYAFGVTDSSGKELIQNIGRNPILLGIPVPSGVDSKPFAIHQQGIYSLQLVLVGMGLVDFDQFAPATINLDFGGIEQSQLPPLPTSEIPPWIKNNAKWWVDGIIGDGDFVSGIQFLVSQGIIRV